MRRFIQTGVVTLLSLATFSASAFMEEGGNLPPIERNGFTRCRNAGDLREAEYYGCNPWMDSDANYSYYTPSDQEKSSLHFNMTAALAVGAGFSRCSAYVIALYDQVTDAATARDQIFWAPFPPGVSVQACEGVFRENKVIPAMGLEGAGAFVSLDFTFRGEGGEGNEVARESMTFHFNPGLETFSAEAEESWCDESGERDPLPEPGKDIVPLTELYVWASTDANPLNQCGYGGPIVAYNPEEDVQPGSLGAFGVFLHAYQDTYSHRDIVGIGHHSHSKNDIRTSSVRGFVTGHFSGDFGLNAEGRLGMGLDGDMMAVHTDVGHYGVLLHSVDTYEAAVESFNRMVDWLHDKGAAERLLQYGRTGARVCSTEDIELFAFDFTSIENRVSIDGEESGAKQRSGLADSFFDRGDCTWTFVR